MTVLPFPLQKGDPKMKAGAQNEERNKEPKTRSVKLPAFLWDVLDEDAERCHRSITKQIEAILVRYYNLEANIELDEEALVSTFQATSHKQLKKAS